MSTSHYYQFEFHPNKETVKIPSLRHPAGFTPILPPVGSILVARDSSNQLAQGTLASVSFAYTPTHTLVVLHLGDVELITEDDLRDWESI